MGYRVPAPHQASVVPGLRWGEGPQEFRKSDLEEQGPHIMVQVGDEEGSSQPAPHPPLAPANCGGGIPWQAGCEPFLGYSLPPSTQQGPGSVGTPGPTQTWGRLQAAERPGSSCL